jgi:hypothetical protein
VESLTRTTSPTCLLMSIAGIWMRLIMSSRSCRPTSIAQTCYFMSQHQTYVDWSQENAKAGKLNSRGKGSLRAENHMPGLTLRGTFPNRGRSIISRKSASWFPQRPLTITCDPVRPDLETDTSSSSSVFVINRPPNLYRQNPHSEIVLSLFILLTTLSSE